MALELAFSAELSPIRLHHAHPPDEVSDLASSLDSRDQGMRNPPTAASDGDD
ncbi:hypothetical protein [Nonomuraea monospora]|uniref:hypothetical protein n=1 Tax=Nonomuraea monospora TaxID=568818 RepID=UPI0031D9EB25